MSEAIEVAYGGRPDQDIPNPGSTEAVAAGCTCPVVENGHGKGAYGGAALDENGGSPLGAMFWIAEGCPLHDPGLVRPWGPTQRKGGVD